MVEALPLRTEAVSKAFRKPGRRGGEGPKVVQALHEVSLEVARGQIYGLLGANGSGKSTLVRIIATLLLPDSGQATVFGRDVTRDAAIVRRLVNRVSVEAAFFKKLSPVENLLYTARLYGLGARQAVARAREIVAGLGFPMDRVNEPMENLSRGQQQKVAIARGLITAPMLLLLDEPTTGLDPRSKREVQTFVRAIRDEQDAAVLFTTHDMAEADALCDRVAIMDEGRIVAEGSSAKLKRRARSADLPDPSLEDVFMALTGHAIEDGPDQDE